MIQAKFNLSAPAFDLPRDPLLRECNRFVSLAKKPRVRTLVQFCEDDLIIPEGKYVDRRFRYSRAPYAKLIHSEVDSGRWKRFVGTGCVQSGKTYHLLVCIVLYFIFELKETFVIGLPSMELAGDKWRNEIRPSIMKQPKFAKLLPKTGLGSRGGGKVAAVTFDHGPELKFMTAGGDDATRSGYTARVGAISEADKMDEASETSREADPVTQIEARLGSFGDDGIMFMECTVSTEFGRIWKELTTKSSQGKIVCPCPHCGVYVTPERKHFTGWDTATTERGAAAAAHFKCPACEVKITDPERREMNLRAKMIHGSQKINKEGVISGAMPETYTCGIRYSAFNNLFWSSAYLGRKEFARQHSEDEDNAEKEASQFRWVEPYTPMGMDVTHLDQQRVKKRQDIYTKGQFPDDTEWITMGIDLGKRVAHWVLLGWRTNRQVHCVDYGKFEVPSDDIGVEKALKISLYDWKERLTEIGLSPDAIWVDARYQGGRDRKSDQSYPVYEFMADMQGQTAAWMPVLGWDTDRQSSMRYTHPSKNKTGVTLGNNYHVEGNLQHNCWIANVNSDYWKLQVHRMLLVPRTASDGTINQNCLTLFRSLDPNEHTTLTKHITAEVHRNEWDPKQGKDVAVWEQKRHDNHFLDALAYATCAGSWCEASATILADGEDNGDQEGDKGDSP